MEHKPFTEKDAAELLDFLHTFQTLPKWRQHQIVLYIRWCNFKRSLPGCMRSVISKLTGPQVAALAVVLALVLYLAIGAEVNYSPDLVRVLASVGAIIGAALGKAFA